MNQLCAAILNLVLAACALSASASPVLDEFTSEKPSGELQCGAAYPTGGMEMSREITPLIPMRGTPHQTNPLVPMSRMPRDCGHLARQETQRTGTLNAEQIIASASVPESFYSAVVGSTHWAESLRTNQSPMGATNKRPSATASHAPSDANAEAALTAQLHRDSELVRNKTAIQDRSKSEQYKRFYYYYVYYYNWYSRTTKNALACRKLATAAAARQLYATKSSSSATVAFSGNTSDSTAKTPAIELPKDGNMASPPLVAAAPKAIVAEEEDEEDDSVPAEGTVKEQSQHPRAGSKVAITDQEEHGPETSEQPMMNVAQSISDNSAQAPLPAMSSSSEDAIDETEVESSPEPTTPQVEPLKKTANISQSPFSTSADPEQQQLSSTATTNGSAMLPQSPIGPPLDENRTPPARPIENSLTAIGSSPLTAMESSPALLIAQAPPAIPLPTMAPTQPHVPTSTQHPTKDAKESTIRQESKEKQNSDATVGATKHFEKIQSIESDIAFRKSEAGGTPVNGTITTPFSSLLPGDGSGIMALPQPIATGPTRRVAAAPLAITGGITKKVKPQPPDVNLERLWSKGRFAEAKPILKILTTSQPQCKDYARRYYIACVQTAEWHSALNALDNLASLDVAARDIYYCDYGRVLFELGRYEPAKKSLNKALSSGVDTEPLHKTLLLIAIAQNDDTSAETEYKKLIKLNSNDFDLKLELAELLWKQNKKQESLKLYDEVAQSFPANSQLQSKAAYGHLLQGEYKAAVDGFKLAAQSSPQQKRYQDAAKFAEKQLASSSDKPAAAK